MYKPMGCLAVLITLLVFPIQALTVSLLVVETGIAGGGTGSQFSSAWEGGIMAAFFDAGHIVTNSPIVQMEKKPVTDLSSPVEADFIEAVMGGADYYILGFLEYQGLGRNAVPVGITLKIFKADSTLIYENDFPAGTGKTLNDEYRNAQNIGTNLIPLLER